MERITCPCCQRTDMPLTARGAIWHHNRDVFTGARTNGVRNRAAACPASGQRPDDVVKE